MNVFSNCWKCLYFSIETQLYTFSGGGVCPLSRQQTYRSKLLRSSTYAIELGTFLTLQIIMQFMLILRALRTRYLINKHA